MKKETILVKISGASLKQDNEVFSKTKLHNLAMQIKELSQDYNVGIVIGGGNIFRGNLAKDFDMERSDADYMGMLATIMNGMILQNVFENVNVKSKIYSALEVNSVCEPYIIRKAVKALQNGYVCIFVAGTGSPYVTTDTGAALRACQIKANKILMAKNGVDGVYDCDPHKNKKATRFDSLTYHQVIEKKLQVMDSSALTLCEDQNIEIIVFNIDHENALVKAIKNQIPCTKIKN